MDPDVYIQRAHRLGAINRRHRGRGGRDVNQPRPIIINFRDYEVVELIFENAYKLRNTEFGINRDYPREIIEARYKFWPMYKKARGENPKGTVYIGYPAKLIINKRVVADEFPDWRNVLRGSRIQDVARPPREDQNKPSTQGPSIFPISSENSNLRPQQVSSLTTMYQAIPSCLGLYKKTWMRGRRKRTMRLVCIV